MCFEEKIIDAVGEFEALKLEAIISLQLETSDGAWPINLLMRCQYDSKWAITFKFTGRVK